MKYMFAFVHVFGSCMYMHSQLLFYITFLLIDLGSVTCLVVRIYMCKSFVVDFLSRHPGYHINPRRLN